MLKSKPVLAKGYLILAFFWTLAAFAALASVPSDSKNAVILGYSAVRASILGATLLLALGLCSITLWLFAAQDRVNRFVSFLDARLTSDKLRFALTTISIIVAWMGIYILLLPPDGAGMLSAVTRFMPIVYWGIAISIQTLIAQRMWRQETQRLENLLHWKPILLGTFIVLGFFLALWGWITWTRIGLKPEETGWHSPGTPILFAQVFWAWLAGMTFFLFEKYRGGALAHPSLKKISFPVMDVVICLSLWVIACLLWQGEPMRKDSYFAPTPTPPNYERYPYSDAATYDRDAQEILIGAGWDNRVSLRPLYVFSLAIFHAIGGQKYEAVIFLQILVLAVIPALIFLVASMMGNRYAGIVAAIMVILREKNSIALTNVIEVSHSKLWMADTPTMCAFALFVYAFIKWLKKPDKPNYLGLAAGGAFGLVVLIRSQSQLLLPLLLIGIIFSERFQWKTAVRKSFVFIFGLAIVIAPWVWRNHQVSGRAVVENSEFYIRLFAGGYAKSAEDVEMRPTETFDAYYDRMKSQIAGFILENPLYVIEDWTSYFLHNEICSVFYLPLSPTLYDLRAYIKTMSFWGNPTLKLTAGSGLFLLLNLFVITLGVGTAINRLKFLGVMPLIIHLGYNLSVVTARISGWRFVLPMDWVVTLYYCIGLVQLSFIAGSILSGKIQSAEVDASEERAKAAPPLPGKNRFIFIYTATRFALIGLSLPVIQWIIPRQYPILKPDEVVRAHIPSGLILPSGETITSSELLSFLETEKGATILFGRALYPSYYETGRIWGEKNSDLLMASQYDRLQFTLIGPRRGFVFIPLAAPPGASPTPQTN